MAQPCRTCNHPDRERIEVELAMASSVREVSERYDIPRRSLHRHKQEHMTAEQIMRIRGMTPAQFEVNIEELTRRGGEAAVIGFTRIIQECQVAAETCDKLKMFAVSANYRKLQLEAYKEQAKIAAIYPGRKTVNNNLVLGDVSALFDMLDVVLRPYPEARLAVAQVMLSQPPARPVLEHAA